MRRTLVPELFDWLENGLPRIPGRGPIPGAHPIRVEDYHEEGRYVLRAELPGIDPDKDVEISVSDGVLTVRSERAEQDRDRGRCEFRYGSFLRSVALPKGAREAEITATYEAGVLTVTVPVCEDKPAVRHIEVAQ